MELKHGPFTSVRPNEIKANNGNVDHGMVFLHEKCFEDQVLRFRRTSLQVLRHLCQHGRCIPLYATNATSLERTRTTIFVPSKGRKKRAQPIKTWSLMKQSLRNKFGVENNERQRQCQAKGKIIESSMGEKSTKSNIIHHEKKNTCTFVEEEKSRVEKVKSVVSTKKVRENERRSKIHIYFRSFVESGFDKRVNWFPWSLCSDFHANFKGDLVENCYYESYFLYAFMKNLDGFIPSIQLLILVSHKFEFPHDEQNV
ncbi:hypothetical protein M9H77_23887 [Catharanthus roseus]|uniref:Uncharacterized protein n=1 Tax=Catharanthus roseus TaxID=4058 RepID=A0ACC0AVJ4_CATRO|nr:hypothetical protein M9H77_23887 [Catharanthus roseus]